MPEEEAALGLAEQTPLAFILSTPARLTSLVTLTQEGFFLTPSWPGKVSMHGKEGKTNQYSSTD